MDAIRDLTARAFAGKGFSDGSEPGIIDRLPAAGALTLSLIVERDGVVGHAAFSPVSLPSWFGLGPISVTPDLQRRGIGGALIHEGLARLRAQGAAGCVVLGDPGYYGRFGFEADPALTYPPAPAKYFQRLALSGPPAAGDVRFHPAFGENG